jgi:chromosome segregation ATPase
MALYCFYFSLKKHEFYFHRLTSKQITELEKSVENLKNIIRAMQNQIVMQVSKTYFAINENFLIFDNVIFKKFSANQNSSP